MNRIETAFKKLLGNGRAWATPIGFTSEFLEVLISPFVELKEKFKKLKYTHFPSTYFDENNTKNGEELFGFNNSSMSIEERAANVEGQWSVLTGSQHYKQLEHILQKKGLNIRIIENIPINSYNLYGHRLIGNGYITTEKCKDDPIIITDGKHSFVIQAEDFFNAESISLMISNIVKLKPAHNGCFYIPKFLKKKDIHKKLTRNQMQEYRKNQYCNCRPNEFDKVVR